MPSPIDQRERQFVERFPNYIRALDAVREGAYIRQRLASARVQTEPFPYVLIEDILSPEFYSVLDAAWPVLESFPPDERKSRRDLVPRPPGTDPADQRASTYDGLPLPIRQVWDFFVLEVNRHVVGPWLRQIFASSVDSRLALIERSWHDQRVTKDYFRPPYTPLMNVGRLMMRAQGFRLRPHADALPYLVTALYYFPDGLETVELGTTLYRTEGVLDDASIVDHARTMYFDEAGVAASPAVEAPFKRNTLLAFANTNRSAHGMHITTPGVWRRAYQSHLSIKSDTHHL